MSQEPVAIIGMSCRIPGGVADLPGLWSLLAEGRDAIGEIPSDRIDIERYCDATPGAAGKINTRVGGYLGAIDQFDTEFFGIAPRDAACIDPQHRLMLELAWEALEDAGQDIRALEGSDTGVYIGAWTSDFENRLHNDPAGTDLARLLGAGRFAACGFVSYCLDLRGPSFMLDTACAASLVGVHLAVRALRDGACRLALAGAVNLILNPHLAIAYNSARLLAADGRCKFGDAAADGFVRSEAAGMVALKTLTAAQADGDRIHAVIRGTAIGNDGRASLSMGRPSREGQAATLRAACRDGGVEPGAIGYVEAHGTGTRAGDPVELGALAEVMGEARPAGFPLLVGSIKTNIGHAEAAAGIAGLIKAALVVRIGEIPRSLHFNTPHPGTAWADAPLRIVTETTAFPTAGVRMAGVSSYGIAGANAHAVLEAPPSPPPSYANAAMKLTGALLLPLSARGSAALRALALRYADLLGNCADDDDKAAAAICWGAATRRTALTHRAAFVAGDAAALIDALRRFSDGEAGAAVANAVVRDGAPPRVAFVLPGHGGQFIGMGRQMLAENPAFRAAIAESDAAVQALAGWSVIAQLTSDAADLDRMDKRQPLLCALAIAYAAALRAGGVHPAALVGHSMGEVAAAAIAGVLDIPQAMRVICDRGALMQPAMGKGAMALVELSAAETREMLKSEPGDASVVVAAVNAPRMTVIAGDTARVHAVTVALRREGVFCQAVKLDLAAHSPQMDQPAAVLAAALAGLNPRKGAVPIYSTVHAARQEGPCFDAAYWAANMREPVRFLDAVRAMVADGVNCFIELGAHPVLTGALQQIAPDRLTLACGRRGQAEDGQLLSVFGALWAAGSTIDWRQVIAPGGWIDLPLYPWQRQRHWAPAAELRPSTPASESDIRLDETQRGWLYRLDWKPAELPAGLGTAGRTGRWLVLGPDRWGRALADALDGEYAQLDALIGDHLGEDGFAVTLAGITGLAVLVEDSAHAAFSAVRVLQAVLRARHHPRLWFVTRHGQAVTNAERVSADLAACWGAARAIGEEHPALWGGLADIGSDDPGSGDLAALARHLRGGDCEDQVAFREGKRLVPRLLPSAAPSAPYAWRRDAAYLITGGLGGVGLQVARQAALSGARRLILLGRAALPPRESWGEWSGSAAQAARIAAIRALEARGVAVHVESLDVADETALRGFLARYRAEGWPPIRGVLHAAAALKPMLASESDALTFGQAMAAKLRGAQLLDRLLPDVEMFALFSSVTAVIPHAGTGAYAAANAGVDALASDRRARGLPAVSIAWGPWRDTGLASGDATQEMARIGLSSLPPVAAAEVFAALCGDARPSHTVIAADWAAFRRGRTGRPTAMFYAVFPAAADSPGMAGRLASASPFARRARLETLVRDAIGGVLQLPPGRLDDQAVLGELGLGSMLAIELRNRLEVATGLPLPATLAWNHPTISAIAGFLDRAFAAPAAAAPEAARPPAAAASIEAASIAAMTDDEALKLLMAQPG